MKVLVSLNSAAGQRQLHKDIEAKAVKALSGLVEKNSDAYDIDKFDVKVTDYPQLTSTLGETTVGMSVTLTLVRKAGSRGSSTSKPSKSARSSKTELTDDRFTPVQRKKLQDKSTKLIITMTSAYVRKSDNKSTPQLIKNEYAIDSIEVTSTGKLKKVVIERLPKSRKRELVDMSASALLKLLTGEKASLKSAKGTKSAALK